MATKTYEISEPHASALLESLRAVGYSLETALADLIDNSITAGARHVWLNFMWSGANSYLTIRDDGKGMTDAELSIAMRPGSKNPRQSRDKNDLGRFGLGLKTASFSQCRRLTVASRAAGGPVVTRRWDLDHVQATGEWQLLLAPAPGSDAHLAALHEMPHGTVVLWEVMDRVVDGFNVDSKGDHDRFLKLITTVESHLAMVFHRYLAGPRQGLKLFLNGTAAMNEVKPWDPFLLSHPATFSTPVEPISCGNGIARVQGHVLPHKDKLGEELFQKTGGPSGWNVQQGFYVYRNNRLLVAGSWLDLGFTKEEHYKLARISVDIPNTMDDDWDIDVKKSRARPPARLRNRLRTLAQDVRKQAREVYVHRGAYGKRGPQTPLVRAWKPITEKGRLSYRVDRNHPLVKEALSLPPAQQALVKNLISLLEETVPVQQIWLDAVEKPELHARPFEHAGSKAVKEVLLMTYQAFRKQGLGPDAARQHLSTLEPFNEYPELVATLPDS